MTVYERVRALREEQTDYTQTELGKILNMSQLQISRIETGRAHLKGEDIIAYCSYFGVSADYILGLPKNLKYPER